MKKILLAYSGGLDTSCILTWLKEKYGVPVVAYCADVGQSDDLSGVNDKALKTGAQKCIVEDLKSDFVENYIFPSIKANALYEGHYLLGTSLARPCIAQGMVTAALKEGCDAIAHGATGKGNDQVRFELAIKSLAPHLTVIAPWRTWQFSGRNDLIDYAQKNGIPVPVSKEKPYSTDSNMMHISYEGGILEDPAADPPADLFQWTTDPEKAPDKATEITVQFELGIPVALNGKRMAPVELIAQINKLGADNGVGRVDIVENRFIGIKSRGVYETPGVTILLKAHQAVESLTLDREVAHMKEELALKFAQHTYNGFWFAPEAVLVRKFIDFTQTSVTGWAKLKLYKGNVIVTARHAESSLYDHKMSSFEEMGIFNQSDSGGFININGLRLTAWSKCNESIEKSLQGTT